MRMLPLHMTKNLESLDFPKLLDARECARDQHTDYADIATETGSAVACRLRDAWYSWWQELDEEVNRQIEEEARHVD